MNGSVTEQAGTPDVCTDVLRRRVGVATSDAVAVVDDFPEMSTTVQHHCEGVCLKFRPHHLNLQCVSCFDDREDGGGVGRWCPGVGMCATGGDFGTWKRKDKANFYAVRSEAVRINVVVMAFQEHFQVPGNNDATLFLQLFLWLQTWRKWRRLRLKQQLLL